MRRTLLLVLSALALLAAGCGTSGGNDAGTDGGSDGGTTAPTVVTSADLEAILPTAADIGPDYTVKDEEDEDEDDTSTTEAGDEDEEVDPMDAALDEQCPEAAALDYLDEEDDPDEVSVEFETEQDQGIEVSLTPNVPLDEDQLSEVIEAFNDCGPISVDDEDIGTMEMELSAEPLDGFGDYGAQIEVSAEFELFGAPVAIDFTGYLFAVDGVGVTVTASSGLDPNTMEPTPADTDLLPELAAEMESRVRTLTD